MGRVTTEVEYGEMRFIVRQLGGTDGMDVLLLLAQGVVPALGELAKASGDLKKLLSPEFRAIAKGVLEGSVGEEEEGGAKSVLQLEVAHLSPVFGGLQKLLGALTQEQLGQLRAKALFSGSVQVIYPESSGQKRTDNLDKKLWDQLFQGDPLGAWWVLFLVLKANVGKSSPAIAALFRRGLAGTPSSSGTSTT